MMKAQSDFARILGVWRSERRNSGAERKARAFCLILIFCAANFSAIKPNPWSRMPTLRCRRKASWHQKVTMWVDSVLLSREQFPEKRAPGRPSLWKFQLGLRCSRQFAWFFCLAGRRLKSSNGYSTLLRFRGSKANLPESWNTAGRPTVSTQNKTRR